MITTFIIPSIGRSTINRAVASVEKMADADYLVGFDDNREGAGATRNRIIADANTEWLSFLDDDDTVTADYTERLMEEIENHPEADIIYFREFFLWGQVIPLWPHAGWGNIGISFSVKRKWALDHPFKSEPYEDYEFIHRLLHAGAKIHFSEYLTYRARH